MVWRLAERTMGSALLSDRRVFPEVMFTKATTLVLPGSSRKLTMGGSRDGLW